MSVKVCDRTKGKLEVLTKAMDLAAFTIKICDNDNVFPKRHRLSVNADIIKEVKMIAKLINLANTKRSKCRRLELQEQALDLTNDIEVDMEIAYRTIRANFTEDKLDNWLGLLLEVHTLLKSWIKSEIKKD